MVVVVLSIAIRHSVSKAFVALFDLRNLNALGASCATEMAVWIGFGGYENKGIVKTLLWLNLLENLKIRL